MKLIKYTFCFFFLNILFEGITSLYAQESPDYEKGEDWDDCDKAIRQFNSDFDRIVTNSSELLYSASGLPDLRDNPVTVAGELSDAASDIRKPTLGGAFDAWNQVLDYHEDAQRILENQDFALNGIANDYFAAIEGKDC